MRNAKQREKKQKEAIKYVWYKSRKGDNMPGRLSCCLCGGAGQEKAFSGRFRNGSLQQIPQCDPWWRGLTLLVQTVLFDGRCKCIHLTQCDRGIKYLFSGRNAQEGTLTTRGLSWYLTSMENSRFLTTWPTVMVLSVPDHIELGRKLAPPLPLSILRFPEVWACSTFPVLLTGGMVHLPRRMRGRWGPGKASNPHRSAQHTGAHPQTPSAMKNGSHCH